MGKLKPTHAVLWLLCLMYFITYVDRVNIGMAAPMLESDLRLSHSELGLVFSAFAYPYLLFQVFGGWIGDRFGPRRTLFCCGLVWASATILTGFVSGMMSLFLARVWLGFGEGATFPTATRAIQTWTPVSRRGFAQGLTHAFARFGNSITPPIVAALMLAFTWRGAFVLLGIASLIWGVVWLFYFRDRPEDHPSISMAELERLPPPMRETAPRPPLWQFARRMWPVTLTYFCYGWSLWLYLNWLPSFFKSNYHLDIGKSALFASGVFFAGVLGDTLGGVISDLILRRTGRLRLARLSVVIAGFLGGLASLTPILFVHDMTVVVFCLSSGFFFAELCIGPMWSIPMDIAPKFSGTAAGVMNVGSALAAIVSPIVAGVIIDRTHDWYLPFIVSIFVMMAGAVIALLINPERPVEPPAQEPRSAKRRRWNWPDHMASRWSGFRRIWSGLLMLARPDARLTRKSSL